MDKSAIEQIQNSAAEVTRTANLQLDAAISTGSGSVVVPDGLSIKDVEHLLVHKRRFSGCMRTTDLQEFCRYSRDQNGEALCFVDAEKMSATSHFDLGTPSEPGHNAFTSTLQMIKTAEYQALLMICDQKITQRGVSEWVEDWSDNIAAMDAENKPVANKRVAAALRRITVESSRSEEHEVEDTSAKRSTLESIEASSKSEPLPPHLFFNCIPYHGLQPMQFGIRLSVVTGGSEPMFVLRIKQHEAGVEAMSRELTKVLTDELGGLPVYVGSFS